MTLSDYRITLNNRVKELVEENDISEKHAFFQAAMDCLLDYGIVDSYATVRMSDDVKAGSKAIRIDGYSIDETEHSLNLYICDYTGEDDPGRLISSMLDKLYWRVFYFLESSCSDSPEKAMDVESSEYKASVFIRNRMSKAISDPERVLKIHIVVVTDRELDTKILNQDFFDKKKKTKASKTKKRIKMQEFLSRPVDIDLWPIDRFMGVESETANELIQIDFENDFASDGIPCLKGNLGVDLQYDAYIGIIPGKLLADIYIEFGSRVLEGNVRAFLGTKSAKSVNNGIKKTINNEPYNFFTYNNGIAVTATSITTRQRDGFLYITGITDMQIINGGQTTATLAEAVLKKTNPDLKDIFVPIKLTVIPDRETENEDGVLIYDQMIHDIARFANSQNRVTPADLFSNDPFHVWMEKSSKRYLAPPIHYNIPTGWYYERARKKYIQEQVKLNSDEIKRFQAKYPKKQIITKEQLAMYLTAIACKPHLCSKGKSWVMREYGSEIGEIFRKDKSIFNEYYFKKCVCAAILYMAVDNYLESNKRDPDFWYSAGGYKGNIVPYTVSKIISAIPTPYTLNWMNIWNSQGLSSALMKEVEKVTYMTNEYFCSFTGVLVSEYCKRESTWTTFRDDYPYGLSDECLAELIPLSEDKELGRNARKEQRDTNELVFVMEVLRKGVPYWNDMLQTSLQGGFLSNSEICCLKEVIAFVKKGDIPCSSSGRVPSKTMKMINDALNIESKLNDEGVNSFFDSDDVDELVLDDYKMH